jgi:hypothetical protein
MLLHRRHGRRLLQRVVLAHECCNVPLLGLSVLFKLLHPPVVGLHLLAEYHIFDLGRLFIKFETGDAVEALHVEVSLPPDADAVQDERRANVDLKQSV